MIVDLAGQEGAPVDLLIGTDAFEYASQAARRVLKADEAWRGVAGSDRLRLGPMQTPSRI